jgi:Carboxypeptidase regulatory-like domain
MIGQAKAASSMFFRVFLSLVATLTLVGGALAQGGSSGAISGSIKDEKGAAVTGAQVEIINAGTGVTERTTTSDAGGNFTVTQLPPGTYKLLITAAGFSKTEVPDVKVNVTEITSVNVPLKVGQITESVTVVEAASQIQLNSATTGQTLQSTTINALPLATRNFLTLLTLSTGANTEMFQSDALGRGAVTINVNGQRPVNNNYQLEGINANDINLPILDNVPLPNPSTVQEFKTQTSLYDASQGRNGGGNIQVALKSGTNEFHGDGFFFLRNDVLNANDFFRNRNGQPRPRYRQGVYGVSIGGPIYVPRFGEGGDTLWSGQNKHFFFFNYQGTHAASGTAAGTNFATNIPVLPTNRSEANLIATFFPGGLPAGFTGLNPVALAFLNLPGDKCPGFGDQFCIPTIAPNPLNGPAGFNGPGGTLSLGTVNRAALGTFKDNQFTLTTDHQITTNNKLTFRYFQSANETLRPFGAGGLLRYAQFAPGRNKFLKLGLTSVITPRIVNDFKAGLNRFFFSLQPDEPITLSDIGAVRGNSAQFPGIYQAIVTGAFSIGAGVNDDRGGTFNTFVLGDDLSWSRGNHNFRFGAEGSYYELNRFNNFATRGSVTFGNTITADGLVGFQNFLLGRVTTTQGRAGFSTFYFRALDHSYYAQDDWKVTPRLTMNLGFRLEGLSIAHEKFNFLSNFRGLGDGEAPPLAIINPEETPVVGTPGVSRCTMLDCFKFYPAPRFGFAYDLFGDQTTVVRGGYGIYFQRVSNQSLLQTSGGSPFSEDFSAAPFSVTPQNPFPGQRPNSDFPLSTVARVPLLTAFLADGTPVFDSANGAPLGGFRFFPMRDFKAPYAQQWNLTVQRQLPWRMVAEIGYVGTNGRRLIGTGAPVNPGQICTTASPCVIPASLATNVSAGDIPAGTPGVTRNSDGSISITNSTAENINARVPPQYLGLATSRMFAQTQHGFSQYHSLQASLVRQFSDGIYFQAAYTFGKSIDNGSGSSFGDELNGLLDVGDLLNARSNKGLSDFDRTHRLVISYNYEFPFARWLSTWPRKLVDGWSVNGVSTFQSGTPFLIADFGAFTLQDTDFVNGSRATIGSGNILTSGSTIDRIDNYVNLDAFIAGGRCVNDQNQVVSCASPSSTGFAALGDIGRNVFRGPFQTNHDLSIVKRTNLTETINLEFRAEAFNFLNHPTFQSPSAAGGSFGNYGIVDVSTGDSSILATANRPRTIQFGLKLNF